jgi:hypothetical protein
MEGQPVVKALAHELQEILDRYGGGVGIELEQDLAAVLHFNLYHMFFSLPWRRTVFTLRREIVFVNRDFGIETLASS